MPGASLAEAFGAPISLLNVSKSLYDKESNSINSSTSNDIKNPNYSQSSYQFQNNYKINSISDLETMADDINNLYNQPNINTRSNTNTRSDTNNQPNTNTRSNTDNRSDTKINKNFSDNECDTLISRVLSCTYCRKKLMKYFNNDIDKNVHSAESEYIMRGGSKKNSFKSISSLIDIKLIINIFIGIVFIYIFDILMI